MKRTLRQLFEQLLEFASQPFFYYGRDDCANRRAAIHNELVELGGEKIGDGDFALAYRFNFPSGSYVAKVATSHIGVNRIRRDTLENNPFFSERYLRPIFTSKYVAIQEYIKPLQGQRAIKASNALAAKLRDGTPKGYSWHEWRRPYDAHHKNVGYCPRRKRVMLFDARNLSD